MTAAGEPAASRLARWRAAAGSVLDPELPVLTLADLGVLRAVREAPDGAAEVDITPTYSGCPALGVMAVDVAAAVCAAGAPAVRVRTVLHPAWSTDQMTAQGRRRLAAYGVAPPPAPGTPPAGRVAGPVPVALSVRCPRCGSTDTTELSRFGSTACKSLWRCRACLEPFDHFKRL